MLRLAFRNVFRHRTRTTITLFAIALGVAAIIISGGFVQDIFVQLREATIHSQLGHIQVHRYDYSAHERTKPYDYLIQNPSQIIQHIRHWPEIKDVLMRLRFAALANNGRGQLPIIGEGVQPQREARLGSFLTITEGRQLRDSDAHGILLGQGVARALGLHPGNLVTLLVTTPSGALNTLDFDVVGVFRSFAKDYDDRAVRIPLAAAQELLDTAGISTLVISLRKTRLTRAVAEHLEGYLPKGQFEVQTWYQLADFYRQTVALFRRQFGVLQVIVLIMVLLAVASSVNMAIFERTGEFGTQMALGDRSKDILKLVMLENFLLGLSGACIGVLVGLSLAWILSTIGIPMPPPPNSSTGYIAHIRAVPSIVVTAFAVGLVATVLAAVFPARRAARLPVAEALRESG